MSPLNEWTALGKWKRLSPCGRYQIDKVYIASEGGSRYYAYPKHGPKLGGPFLTAGEAWDCCASDEKAAA